MYISVQVSVVVFRLCDCKNENVLEPALDTEYLK